MVKVLLDTNVLITADRGAGSYGRRILDLILQGKVQAIVSQQVKNENLLIVNKLIKDKTLKNDISLFLANSLKVKPVPVKVKSADPEDRKMLAAAVGGWADFLITEDDHLLSLSEYQKVKIISPREFWQWWQGKQDESGQTWNIWVRDIFNR